MTQPYKLPEFFNRAMLREWLSPYRAAKLMRIGGKSVQTFLTARELSGRPINRVNGWVRPLDIIAAGRADGLSIDPPHEHVLQLRLEDLRRDVRELERYLAVPKHRVSKLDIACQQLTGSRMLSEEEVVQAAAGNDESKSCGVYFLVQANRVVYVGQSRNVLARVQAHEKSKEFSRVAMIRCRPEQLDVIESLYIHAFRPPLNGGGNAQYPDARFAPLTFARLVEMGSRGCEWRAEPVERGEFAP